MIKLYSLPGCYYCTQLAAGLKNKGIEFEEIKDRDLVIEVASANGIVGVPMLEVEGRVMNSMQAINWLKEHK